MTSTSWFAVVSLAVQALVCLKGRAHGKLVTGALSSTSKQWQFLTKFCFAQSRGSLSYEFYYPVSYALENILMYYDDQWPLVYQSSSSCWEKQQVLNRSSQFNIIPLTDAFLNSGCTRINNTSNDMYYCSNTLKFSTSRDRWWFFAVANCQSQQGLDLMFSMHLRNGDPLDIFFSEFSADEFYILPVDIMFFGVTCIILAFAFYVGRLLNKLQLLHSTFKLFIASSVLECVHLMIAVIAYTNYAYSGLYPDDALTVANVIGATGTVTFILLLLLIALGYTITLGRLQTWLAVTLAVFICVYYFIFILLHSLFYYTSDETTVSYLFNSPIGYVVVGLRLLAWCAFMVASLRSAYKYSKKRKFYTVFIPLCTAWFWASPIVVFIAAGYINPWALQKVVNGLELSVTFFGFIFFLLLTRPTKANKNFPYHIRTCQISAMSEYDAYREEMRIRNCDVPREGVNFDALFTVATPKSGCASPVDCAPDENSARVKTSNCGFPIASLDLSLCTRFGNQCSFTQNVGSCFTGLPNEHAVARVTELPSILHSVE